MTDSFVPEAITAFFQVVIIDLSLAGDNAIVVGMAAAGLPPAQRTRAILFGMMGATVLLVLFAGVTTQLLKVVGLLLAGGGLLLWESWKMWRELTWFGNKEMAAVAIIIGVGPHLLGPDRGRAPRHTFAPGARSIASPFDR